MACTISHSSHCIRIIIYGAVLALFYQTASCVAQSQCGASLCLGGICDNSTGTPTCTCSTDFTNCTLSTNSTCTDVLDYCLQGSTCVDNTGEITCQCTNDTRGDRCEYASGCSDCQNSGVCYKNSLDSTDKICECTACYTGDTCTEPVNICGTEDQAVMCNNATGICAPACQDGAPASFCQCNNGYSGNMCQFDNDECNPTNPCQNSGQCVNTEGSYFCNCADGWMGKHCDQDIDECNMGYCDVDNYYNCTNTDGGYSCLCNTGYGDDNCTTPTCGDDPRAICNNNGNCTTNSTDWSCDCDQFYEGSQCEIAGPCLDTSLCVNGNCTQSMLNSVYEHTCVCETGWTNSSNCAENIDECSVNSPCQNEAICTDTPGSFMCNCTEYWTGDLCDVDVKECDESPNVCSVGSCMEESGNYSCDCTGTGYEGRDCSADIDECLTYAPCMNSGTCTNNMGSYKCSCAQGWLGDNCEIRDFCSDQCVVNNTVGGNTCLNLPTRANCSCAPGYITSNCGVMDPCADNPCNLGTCVTQIPDGVNVSQSDVSYICQCTERFTGPKCDSPAEITAEPNLDVLIAVPLVCAIALALIVGFAVCFFITKKKRATRGRYSPSRNEVIGPNLQMAGVLKPPPEERLI